MHFLRRRRDLLGNVGLVLFVAFLATFGSGAPVSAAADPQTEVLDATWDGTTLKVSFKVELEPTTRFEPSTFEVLLGGSKLRSEIQQVVYEVYEGVNQVVYATVYLLVYDMPPDVVIGKATVSVRVEVDETADVVRAVYVELQPPKPDDGGTVPPIAGGGGGAGNEAPAGVIDIDSGTGQAVYTVDPDKLADLAGTASTAVLLEIPSDADVTAASFRLPASALDAVRQAGRGLTLAVGPLNVRVELDARAVADLAEATTLGTVVFSVAAVPAAETPSAPAEPGFRGAGDVFAISAHLEQQGSREPLRFSSQVALAIPYDPARLGNLPAWKLGAYVYDEATGAWRFAGGKVDANGRRVVAFRNSFSLYRALAYDKTFADIQGHWAQSDIELMASHHVARGVDADRFNPSGAVTRAEFAALLVRALGMEPLRPERPTFADVGPDHWGYGEIEAAAAAGLIAGVAPGRFEPAARITRQEMAVMLLRALRRLDSMPGVDAEALLSGYADAGAVAPWAREAVAAAVAAGLLQGRTPTLLAPQAATNRAEAVVLIKRLLLAADRL